MYDVKTLAQKRPRTRVLQLLADPLQRQVLAVLATQDGSMTVRELAAKLVATGQGGSAESVRAKLRHVHLPKLEAAGFVSWDQSRAVVTGDTGPTYTERELLRVVEAVDEGWGDVLETVTCERRRTVLAVLDSRSELSLDDLAREVAAREAAGSPPSPGIDDLRLQLHHVHLPKLEQAGVVDYDPENRTVTSRGLPALPGEDVVRELLF